MFEVDLKDIQSILADYGIKGRAVAFSELQRHHYERSDPNTKQVRLICKAELSDGSALVVRFKNEEDVTRETLERQSSFAMALYEAGIPTPRVYRSRGSFVRTYFLNGYEVQVAVEEFVSGELKGVDEETAEKTGRLLARMHNLAEAGRIQVSCPVLFDAFGKNDLFDIAMFRNLEQEVGEENRPLYETILTLSGQYMQLLAPLKERPRYAVQGDISDCNLYRTAAGEIGVFDFNWCGDNILFCDAVMQGIFEARLMDYPEAMGHDREERILRAFWKGYQSLCPASEQEKRLYPYLMAIIDAFWLSDLKWDDVSLMNQIKKGNKREITARLEKMKEKLIQYRKWKL